MTITVDKHYKLHVFIFSLLSIFLFIIVPVDFISKFLAAAICIGVLLHIKKVKFEYRRWYEVVVFIVVNAYLTLAFFGYGLFIDNRDIVQSFAQNPDNAQNFAPIFGALYFGLMFVWTSYILQSFLSVIATLCCIKDRLCTASNSRYWKKWSILLVIMFAMFAIWQVAYNPIVMSGDSWGYLGGWLTGAYDSFRSPMYAFLIKIICSIAPTKPEVLWVAIAQNLAFSSLLATILMYFYRRWVKFKYIILTAVILPLIPSFGLHTIVVWADLACGMSILWLTYILVRVFDEVIVNRTASKKQQVSFCIQLCLSLVLAFFIRSNSFLVYLVMAPILALMFMLWKQWKLLGTIVLSALIVLLIQFPGYKVLNVQSGVTEITSRTGSNDEVKYYAALHDIQAVYYDGGELSEKAKMSLREHILNLDDLEAKAAFAPGVVRYEGYAYNTNGLTISEFISMYSDAFINNPFKMTQAMLSRVVAYWSIDKGSVNLVGYTNLNEDGYPQLYLEEAPMVLGRQENFFTYLMDIYTKASNMHIPSIFIWRFGIWAALMVVSILTLILQRRYIWLLAYLPVFVYLATLYLSSGWRDYRYGLPVFFVGLFMPLAMVMLRSADIKEEI